MQIQIMPTCNVEWTWLNLGMGREHHWFISFKERKCYVCFHKSVSSLPFFIKHGYIRGLALLKIPSLCLLW